MTKEEFIEYLVKELEWDIKNASEYADYVGRIWNHFSQKEEVK